MSFVVELKLLPECRGISDGILSLVEGKYKADSSL